MKKTTLFLLLLPFAFVFSSCSNDNIDTSDIIGTWKLSQIVKDIVVDPSEARDEIINNLEVDGIAHFVFQDNGIGKYSKEDNVSSESWKEFTYTLKKKKLKIYIKGALLVEYDAHMQYEKLMLSYDILHEFNKTKEVKVSKAVVGLRYMKLK